MRATSRGERFDFENRREKAELRHLREEGRETPNRAESCDRVEFFEGRGECVLKGPHRARLKFRILRLKIVDVDHGAEVLREIGQAAEEGIADDELRPLVGEITA